MSTYPSLEGRVSAQEHRQIILDARIEDLSRDMTIHNNQLSERIKELADNLQNGFNDLAKYQIATEQQIDTKFSQMDARLDKMDTRLDKMEQSFTSRFTTIETALAQILARLPEKP